MNENEFRQFVADDIAKERRQTLILSCLGLLFGSLLSVLPILTLIYLRQYVNCILYLFFIVSLAPIYLGQLQKTLKDQGNTIISELVGYICIAVGIPGWILLLNSVLIPYLSLTSYYADQGRYRILTKFALCFEIFSRYSWQISPDMRILIQASCLKAYFLSADFVGMQKLADIIVKKADELYKSKPTAINHECLCLSHATAIGLLASIDKKTQAITIWQNLLAKDQFDPKTDPKKLAYVYETLAYGAMQVQDYKNCLRYCELGQTAKSNSAFSSKVLDAELATHNARAHLELGNLEQAEIEIENAYQAWRFFLHDSAIVIAESFYIKGRIALANENYKRAKDWLERSLIIRKNRLPAKHPLIVQSLEPLIFCLKQLDQTALAQDLQKELHEISSWHYLSLNNEQKWLKSDLLARASQANSFAVSPASIEQNAPAKKPFGLARKLIPAALLFVVLVLILPKMLIGNLSREVPEGKSAQEYYDLGIRYKTSGWTEQARQSLNKAIALDNGEIGIKAKRYLSTKIPRYPVAQEAIDLNIKAYNASNMAADESEKTWKECISKYPNFEWPYSNLGNLYAQQGKCKEGESLLKKALEINPNYVNAWLHLAECKRKENDLAGEASCAKKAEELDPDDPAVKIEELVIKYH